VPRPPKKPPPRITAWSFSRLRTYEECPARARYQFVDRLPTGPDSPQQARGSEIHQLSQRYLTAKTGRPKLPPELTTFTDEYRELRTRARDAGVDLHVEGEWAFTEQLAPTSWFGDATWLRVKVDAAIILKSEARVIDVKTGKVREENRDQLGLYGLAAFARFPAVLVVQAALWYVDQGVEDTLRFTRKRHAKELRRDWYERSGVMLADRKFVPRPGPYCRWCPFAKGKGGPCKFGDAG
jgi:CRISPR/Cas system-associated exonuclease Cas4 (RecB family)